MTTLAEQLVAHPKWEWRVGMVRGDSSIVDPVRQARFYGAPDIEHPATKGLLLASIRKELGDTVAAYRWPHQTWTVGDTETGEAYASGLTEGEALAAARLKLWNGPQPVEVAWELPAGLKGQDDAALVAAAQTIANGGPLR